MYIEGELPNVVTTGNGNSGFGNGFGDSAWWIIVLLIFGWGGFGNGYGGFGGGYSGGAAQDYVLVSDFAQIERKLDTITSGICDSTYALNNTIVNGFNNTNTAIMTSGYETRNAINGLSTQLASCCCGIEKELLEGRYLDAQNFCALGNAINTQTREILEGQRASTDAILGFLTNEKISGLQAENAALTAQISQAAQTATILNAVNRTPVAAYTVPNPYCCYGTCNTSSCGCC